MNDQGELFPEPVPNVKDRKTYELGGYPPGLYDGTPPHEAPETSQQAAVSIVEVSGAMRRKVLGYIASRGAVGATDDEIEAALGMRHQTASARRRELALLGKIVSTSSRLTRSGRPAKVWVVR